MNTSNRLVAGLGFALSMGASSAGAGSVLRVPEDFPAIQAAIDASADGDIVEVSPGTWFEQIAFPSHAITVRSEAGPESTIIDATYLGPVVHFGPTATRASVLEGFTITHGQNDSFAGGVEVLQGSPTIVGNRIVENLGGGQGNGVSLYFSSALVLDNDIRYNANGSGSTGGGGGGGIGVGGNPCGSGQTDCGAEVRGNWIEGNTVTAFTSGGGIYLNAAGPVRVVGNVIIGNTAPSQGGGIALFNRSDARIENNLIVGNRVTGGSGGGVYWLTPSGARGPFLVGNTLIANAASQGSAVYADGFDLAARIVNNMILGAQGVSPVACGNFGDASPPVIRNNDVIVAGAPEFAGVCAGALGSNGNLSVEPLCLSGRNDCRPVRASASVDAGENSFVAEPFDLLGRPRITDGNGDGTSKVDIGAYETPAVAAARRKESTGPAQIRAQANGTGPGS